MTDTNTAGAVVDVSAVAENPAAANEAQIEGQQAEAQAEAPQLTAEERLKKIENALQRKERRIGQLTAREKHALRENQEMRTELERLKQPHQASQSGEPKEDDPKYAGNYVEYLKDLAKYQGKSAAAEELTAGQRKLDESRTAHEQQAWKVQRDEHLDSNAETAEAAFSDFANVIQDATDTIASLSPHVHRAFLEAENGAFALYDLAQNPEALEKLNNMTPYAVAMAVARAEDRALAKSKSKPVTNAPAPLSAAKGTGQGGKSLDQKSGKELLDWVRSG